MKLLFEDKNIDAGSIYFNDLKDSKIFISDFKGKAVIIIGGAQKASKESERWGKALKSIYNDSVDFINVALIAKRHPASIIILVKNQLKKAYGKVPFLINWGNSSDMTNIINENLTHILIIDRQGYQRAKFVENYSDNCLSELKEIVNKYI